MRSLYAILAAFSASLAAPVKAPKDAGLIVNSWIVKLNDGATSEDLQSVITNTRDILKARPQHVYDFGNFKGFSMWAELEAVPSALSNAQAVAFVEQDQIVTVNTLITQQNPPYGLARISHRAKGSSTYVYDSSAGDGTYAYILDTGVYAEHSDFEGRATFGPNFADSDNTDGNGHGTHVAGTIGGKTYGVAKKAKLIGVKVLPANGVGSLSAVIAGLEWAVNDAKNNSRIEKSVANLSLGGGYSPTANAALTEAVNQGLFCAVAAGNSGQPVKTASPASAIEACTIGATDENDVRPDFSNWGNLVDVFAPGVNVQSAWIDGPDSSAFLSGTSMALPHVAGLGAYLIGLGQGSGGGEALCTKIKNLSTKQAVRNAKSPNSQVAFNGGGLQKVKALGQTWGKREVLKSKTH